MTKRAEQERLFSEHSKIVRRIARGLKRNLPPQMLLDDLEAAGYLGLWDAIVRGRHEGKREFEFYAVTRVRGAILDELRRQDWIPRHARKKEDPPLVLHYQMLEKEERHIALSYEASTEEDLDRESAHRKLRLALEVLPDRDRDIIEQILNGKPQEVLAREQGVSPPRISQIATRAVKTLRKEIDRLTSQSSKSNNGKI